MTTDDRLRELYARALTDDVAKSAGDIHATPEEILALVRRDGPEERRLATLDHVMSCEACTQSFELLRSIEAAGAKVERKRPRRMLPLALAASITLVIGAAVVQQFLLRRPELMRGSGSAITLLAPATDVAAREPVVFAWRPVPGAQRYELEVFNSDDVVIFTTATTDNVVTASSLRLIPQTEYSWWVRAITPAGQITSSARPLRLRR